MVGKVQFKSVTKRFVLSKVDKNYSVLHCENDFLWLKDAGIAIPVYNVDEPKIPLLLSKNNKLLKLFANDVGLLCYRLLSTGIQEKILAHEKAGFSRMQLLKNYFVTDLITMLFSISLAKNKVRLIFLITYQDEVLPIEIKSGKDYKEHSALNNLLSKKEYDIHQALVFGNCNVEIRDEETYLPIYMIDFLRQETI